MLCVAAQYGETDVVVALCRRGADTNAQDKNGNTPLSMAAHYGHESIVEKLIEFKADVDLENRMKV